MYNSQVKLNFRWSDSIHSEIYIQIYCQVKDELQYFYRTNIMKSKIIKINNRKNKLFLILKHHE